MWATIFGAVTSLAQAFIVFFGAFEKLAKAADHIAEIAEQSAGLMADESQFNRAQKRRELDAKVNAPLNLNPPAAQP